MASIQLISDLHTELYEHPLNFIQELDPVVQPPPDFLVLAGDIVQFGTQSCEQILAVFDYFCRRARHVLYVTGNHEYWHGTSSQAEFILKSLLHRLPNFHWLNNSSLRLDGFHFVGGTMWFPFKEDTSWRYEKDGRSLWSDFEEIQDIDLSSPWVYKSNKDFTEYALHTIKPGTIVITHHLPNHRSTPPKFRHMDSNRFFVSDQAEVIFTRQPRYWFHGHTHEPIQYKLQETQVVCNPYGYGWQRKDKSSYPRVIVQI